MALLIMSPVSELVSFGLKPGNCVFFNCPNLKVGAIDVRHIQGFSHIFFNF
jgi:ASC-1-like (ASCH) protein